MFGTKILYFLILNIPVEEADNTLEPVMALPVHKNKVEPLVELAVPEWELAPRVDIKSGNRDLVELEYKHKELAVLLVRWESNKVEERKQIGAEHESSFLGVLTKILYCVFKFNRKIIQRLIFLLNVFEPKTHIFKNLQQTLQLEGQIG